MTITPARPEEAETIARLIRATLRHSNAGDYPAAVIEQVCANFDGGSVAAMMGRRKMLVARTGTGNDARIIGTASLEGDVVRTVFIDPARQGQGIGRQLMTRIEAEARTAAIPLLRVPASLTARAFYARLGYLEIREILNGEERTIVMEKALDAAPSERSADQPELQGLSRP